MTPHQMAGACLREAMIRLVPNCGAVLTPQLAYRIKRDTLLLMRLRGLDLVRHKHQIRLEFIRPDAPNLIIPPHLLNSALH